MTDAKAIADWLGTVAPKARKGRNIDVREHVFACLEAGDEEAAKAFVDVGEGGYWHSLFDAPERAMETLLDGEVEHLELLLDLARLVPAVRDRAIGRFVQLVREGTMGAPLGSLARVDLKAAQTLAKARVDLVESMSRDAGGARTGGAVFVAELLKNDLDAALELAPTLTSDVAIAATEPSLGVDLTSERWVEFGRAATRASETYGVDWLVGSMAATLLRGEPADAPRLPISLGIFELLGDNTSSRYHQVILLNKLEDRMRAYNQAKGGPVDTSTAFRDGAASVNDVQKEINALPEPQRLGRRVLHAKALIKKGELEQAKQVLAAQENEGLPDASNRDAIQYFELLWLADRSAETEKQIIAIAKSVTSKKREAALRQPIWRVAQVDVELAFKLAKVVPPASRSMVAGLVLEHVLDEPAKAMKMLTKLIPKDDFGDLGRCSMRLLERTLANSRG